MRYYVNTSHHILLLVVIIKFFHIFWRAFLQRPRKKNFFFAVFPNTFCSLRQWPKRFYIKCKNNKYRYITKRQLTEKTLGLSENLSEPFYLRRLLRTFQFTQLFIGNIQGNRDFSRKNCMFRIF